MAAATDAVWIDVLPAMDKFGPAISKGAGKETEQAGKTLGGRLSSGLTKMAVAGGVAAAAALSKGLVDAINVGQANDKLAAQLGLTAKESERVGKLAGNLYRDAYGESLEEVNAALRGVSSNIGDLGSFSNEALEGMSAKALDLASVMGEDVDRVTRGVGQLIRNDLAPNATEAFDLITAAAQRLPESMQGELIDTIEEYGADFSALGLTGEQAMGALSAAVESGARNVDLAADAFREFSIRAIDGSDLSAAAFADLGFDAEEMSRKIAEGGPAAAGATSEIIRALAGMSDPIAQEAAGVALFGTRFEEMGVDAIAAMDPMAASLGDVAGAADAMGETLNDNFGTRLEGWKRSALGFSQDAMMALITGFENGEASGEGFFGLMSTIGAFFSTTLVPALQTAGQWVQDNTSWLIPLVGAIGALVAAYRTVVAVTAAWNAVLALNPIGLVVAAIAGLVAALVIAYQRSETFRDIVNGAWTAVKGAVEAVVNWFTGTAWPAIKTVWDNIAAGAMWLWNDVLKPAWEGIRLAVAVAIELIKLYWDTILKPVFEAVADTATWLWENVLNPVFGWIKDGWDLLIDGIKAYWNNVLKPVWDAVSAAATWLWERVLRPVFGWIEDRWDALSRAMESVWERVVEPMLEAFGRGVDTLKDAVSNSVEAIGRAWDGLKRAFATPVNWVIDNVLNKFIGWVNDIADDIGISVRLNLVPNVSWGSNANERYYGRNKGGLIPGGGPDRDSVLAYLTPGEFVMSRTATNRLGISNLQALNDGDVPPIGGPMSWLKDTATSALNKAREFIVGIARPGFDAVMGLMDRTVGKWGMPGQLAAGTARTVGDQLLDWMAGIKDEADSRVPQLAGGGFKALLDYMTATGVGHVVTSTLRPGDTGYHGAGKAADFSVGGHGNRGYNHSGLRAIFDALLPAASKLSELILAGAPFNIKNGRQVPGYAWGQPGQPGNHWNHVHAAVFDQGGWLPPGVSQVANWTGRPEPVLTDGQWKALTDRPSGNAYHLAVSTARSDADVMEQFRRMELLHGV